MDTLEDCFRQKCIPHFENGIVDTRREECEMCVLVAVSNQIGGSGIPRHQWARFVVPLSSACGVRAISEPDVLEDWLKTKSDLTIAAEFAGGTGVRVADVFRGKTLTLNPNDGEGQCCSITFRVEGQRLEDIIGKSLLNYFVCELQFMPGSVQPMGRKRRLPMVENICGALQCSGGLKSGVQHQQSLYTLLANVSFDHTKALISFRGARDPDAVHEFTKRYMRDPDDAQAFVSMVVLVGWKNNGNCAGDILERSLAHKVGDNCAVRILPKMDTSINLTKIQVLRWDDVYDEVRDGFFMRGVQHDARPRNGDLKGNQITVSYTGSVMVQFHFAVAMQWTDTLKAMIEVASRMCMQLVCDNC